MLRRVPTDKIRLGMYIHAPDGSWLDFPDWKARFLLADPADLARMRSSGVSAFIIDESRGIGLADAARPRSAAPAAIAPATIEAEPARPPARCSSRDEFDRAAAIVARSRLAVRSLLDDVRLGKAIQVETTVPLVEEITGSIDRNPSTLISITRMKSSDEYTYMHSLSVSALMINFARSSGMDDVTVRDCGIAGLLHDVGKMALPRHLLTRTGALSPSEFAQMQRHTEHGHELLERTPGIPAIALDVARHHHEKMDGTGYPDGDGDGAISLHARMAGICDVYDAITSNRYYRQAAPAADTIADMFQWKGHFDPDVLNAFIRSIGIYPVGSLVRLESDRLAIVTDQNSQDLTRPEVLAFYAIAARRRLTPEPIDLRTGADRILSREQPLKWGFVSWDTEWTRLLMGDRGRIN